MLEINDIYHGNNLELLKLLDNNSVDLFFFSPPYLNVKGKYNSEISNAPLKYIQWFIPRIQEMSRSLKKTGSIIININDCIIDGFRDIYVYELIVEIVKQTNLNLYERLFWNKGKYLPHKSRFGDKIEYLFWFVKDKNFTFNFDSMRVSYDKKSIIRMKKPIKKRFCRNQENQDSKQYKQWKPNPNGASPSTLITIGSESQRISNNHVAVFPVRLAEYFVKGATNENDLVCDPFSGLASTCLAAKNLKRNYIGFEIDQLYIEESKKRLNIA